MKTNKARALDVIEFIQLLKHTGDFYGQSFKLLQWQYDTIWDVYGTVNDKGYRQYQYSYLEIPKKNGKTELVAALSLYHLINDPPSGQIYCCAAEKEQASLVYKAAVQMREQNEILKKFTKLVDSKKQLINTANHTFIKVLSAEAYSKHGLNPTVVIFDELHAQPTRDLWDVMTFGAGAARKEPLWWVITTAGDDPDRASVGWEVHEYARRIQDKEIEDPIWYARLYGAAENDDIFDEAIWYKANPSLGHTIEVEKVRQEAIGARNDPAKEKLFRWLRLNQWVSLKKIGWLPLTLWDSTVGKWTRADLVGKKCYLGLDLASVGDLAGMTLIFPPQEGVPDWRFIQEGWIPEDKMKERIRRDHVPFDRWVQGGFIHATPGDAIDYDFIEARIVAVSKQYRLALGGGDPWNALMLTQKVGKEGIEIADVTQNMANMSPSMKETERLLKTGMMTHEENPAGRWCFGNVNVAVDGNGNIKPMKNKSTDKIDLTVSLINGMAVALRFEKESVYDGRPVGSKILVI